MSTTTLTSAQLDTLRGSQLKEAAVTLERVSYELSMLSTAAVKDDPLELADIAGSISVAQDDLSALQALGYVR